jgi:hypothetical protein
MLIIVTTYWFPVLSRLSEKCFVNDSLVYIILLIYSVYFMFYLSRKIYITIYLIFCNCCVLLGNCRGDLVRMGRFLRNISFVCDHKMSSANNNKRLTSDQILIASCNLFSWFCIIYFDPFTCDPHIIHEISSKRLLSIVIN